MKAVVFVMVCWVSVGVAEASCTLDVDVIGHRGNSSAAPENTVAAIDSAFAVGADHVELDIRLTADGHAVVMHDATIDRTTDGTGAIANMTLAEVRQLDAGSWFGPEFAGEPVPTLGEALAATNQRGRVLLDVKVGGMGAAIQAALDEASLLTGTNISSRDVWIWPGPNADYESNVIEPEYLLGSLPSPANWMSPGYFSSLLDQRILGFDVPGGVTPDFAAAARAAGIVVSVFTINSEMEMQFWIDQGVTAMETDFPEVLVGLVSQPLRSDLDANGDLDGQDWLLYVAGLGAIDPGATDLNGDGVNDHADFLLFQSDFERCHGTGSFAEMLRTVPEPAMLGVIGWMYVALGFIGPARRLNSRTV